MGRDITEKKLAENALIESETQYRNLVENTSDWVWQINLEGIHSYSNDGLQFLLGYRQQELESLSLKDLVHPDELKEFDERLPQLINNKQGWQHWVLKFRHKDGGKRYLDSNATPVFDSSGAITGFSGINRDVTFRTILANITSSLLSIHDDTAAFDDALQSLAEFFQVDIFELWWFDQSRESAAKTYSWRRPGIPIISSSFPTIEIPWLAPSILAGETVVNPDTAQLSADRAKGKAFADSVGITASVLLPLQAGERAEQRGMGVVAMVGPTREWSENELSNLRLAFNVIASAEVRARIQKELSDKEQFQHFNADMSSDLIKSRTEEIDRHIVSCMKRIGQHFQVDRIGLCWFDDTAGMIRRSHLWVNVAIANTQEIADSAELIPWVEKLLESGNTLKIETLDDIPEEGSKTREYFESLGIKSHLTIPMIIEEEQVGLASFSTLEQSRAWTDVTIEQLRLLSENLANVFNRAKATLALQQSERDLACAEEIARTGSFSICPKFQSGEVIPGGKYFFSREWLRIHGLQHSEEFFGKYASLIHPDDQERVMKSWREVTKQESDFKSEYRIIRPDGTIIYLEARNRIVRNEDETEILNVFGTTQDVTERVMREKKLSDALIQIEKLKSRLEEENLELREEIKTVYGFDKIIGRSLALQKCLNLVQKVAPTDAAVLLLGETGVGKELIAHAIHDLSSRKDQRMITVNCAALPAELVESELFGHEKGAFTGANSMRKGRFELANGGTLFLDEIGELPLPLQSKLLRAIQEGEFERLGGSETLKVDVRFIVATNRQLKMAVDRGRFRADLYYRISNFPIEVPSLSERKEDIPLLVEHFVRKLAPRLDKNIKAISSNMVHDLTQRSWPGNVRELEGFIQHALITNEGDVLKLNPQEEEIVESPADPDQNDSPKPGLTTLSSVEHDHIIAVLEQTAGVIAGKKGAAKILGVPPSTLRSRMKRLGIGQSNSA